MRGINTLTIKTPEWSEVRQHISLPTYELHYSRRHTSKKYLPLGIIKSKMYDQ